MKNSKLTFYIIILIGLGLLYPPLAIIALIVTVVYLKLKNMDI